MATLNLAASYFSENSLASLSLAFVQAQNHGPVYVHRFDGYFRSYYKPVNAPDSLVFKIIGLGKVLDAHVALGFARESSRCSCSTRLRLVLHDLLKLSLAQYFPWNTHAGALTSTCMIYDCIMQQLLHH